MTYHRTCSECLTEFDTTVPNKLTCCQECAETRHIRLNRTVYAKQRLATKNAIRHSNGDFKGASTGPTKKIPCLRCDRKFDSDGKGNRLCPHCRGYATTIHYEECGVGIFDGGWA